MRVDQLENSLQRKVPSDREERKASQGLRYGKGQHVDILVGLRKATATVISPTKNGDGVVVRLRQQHNRQLNREKSQELAGLSLQLRTLEERWKRGTQSEFERAEQENIWRRIRQLTDIKPAKITRTFAVAPEQIKTRQSLEQKRQWVSDTEKRKLQKKQLLRQIESKLKAGVSPKRLKRELKLTKFPDLRVGKGKREFGYSSG